MKYKLAIFDMDGTILNTLEDLKNSLNYALQKQGFSPRTTDEVRSFVGNGIRLLIERGVPKNATPSETDSVFDTFNEHYALHCADTTQPYNGIIAAVNELKAQGIKVAVVSNKADYAVQSLCKRYFDGLFDCAIGQTDKIRKKPYPDSVNEILKRYGISPEDTVYIGDSDVDIQTAKNAKTDCISVDWGFRSREFLAENGATHIVSTTDEMLDLIV